MRVEPKIELTQISISAGAVRVVFAIQPFIQACRL